MRVRMGIAIAAAMAMALAACGPKADGPDVTVRALYEPYLKGPGAETPPFDTLDVYTPELKAEIDKAATYASLLDQPVIDADPVIMAQDWEIKAVTVAPVAPVSGDTAQVAARFDNMGHPTEILYDMRLVDGVWRVDNIALGADSLRSIIANALKPIGDPAAMEAPVRAVYTRYATDNDVEALHLWAPLTADLQRQMAMAAAMGRGGEAALLDFDPVVDSKSHDLGPVQYESASAGVITRFDNAREPKIVVYDVAQDGGVWKIANIRSPGHWDLQLKLSEAGIK